jgi:hypothetical protein
LTRYRVGQVVQVRGGEAAYPSGQGPVPEVGSYLRRWEGPAWPASRDLSSDSSSDSSKTFAVRATIQHLVYTAKEQRDELVARSSKGSGPTAVIIPIRKSDAWWAMAQDERQAFFVPGKHGRGHAAIGVPYADRIFRRLYHARYAAPATPQAERWDFVTYFEFPAGEEGLFRALLGELRDPATNPEWAFVEREMEIWTTRL